MNSPDLDRRLKSCFKAVFPTLKEDDAPSASIDSTEDWDSLATLTLFALVEEEFQLEAATEDLDSFVSYQAILALLHGKLAA